MNTLNNTLNNTHFVLDLHHTIAMELVKIKNNLGFFNEEHYQDLINTISKNLNLNNEELKKSSPYNGWGGVQNLAFAYISR